MQKTIHNYLNDTRKASVIPHITQQNITIIKLKEKHLIYCMFQIF